MGMLNRDAGEVIARHRGGAVVVCTMTSIFTTKEVMPSPLNIQVAPLMGGASTIALGIALARPDRRVIVLDGDASLLMQLGSLVTIAAARPRQFYHFVCNNGVMYEGGGRIDIPGRRGVDFEGLARSAGYAATYRFDTAEELDAGLEQVMAGPSPALIDLTIDIPATPGWSNENPQDELPDWWFVQMRDTALATKAELERAGS